MIHQQQSGLRFDVSASRIKKLGGVNVKCQKPAAPTPRTSGICGKPSFPVSEAGDPVDSLPAAILADVLGRVANAGDLAACRLASRALLAASYHCPRVRLCATARARRRLREGGGGRDAFRAAAGNVASLLGPHLRSLALDASEGQGNPDDAMWVEEGEFDEADDLHLTSAESVVAWAATAAGPTLREVDIADFWPQSCWRKAEALPVISRFCYNHLKLGLRNAWLSVDGLKIMPNLTHMTLEFIRLDDEDLSRLNECFPCLQILSLIEVGGLKNPKIHLPQLKTCRWEVSNVPRSLAIHVPNLVYLELKVCSTRNPHFRYSICVYSETHH